MEKVLFTSMGRDELQEMVSEVINRKQKPINEQKEEKPSLILYTTKQACDLFHKTRVTLHNWRKKGFLPFRKVNGSVYFTKNDIQDCISRYDHSTLEGILGEKGDKNESKI
jgi:hypothetical protein